ncbi:MULTISPECIES: TRAP transporter small permease [Phyllobacteriaceae]|uniref:TRAP transporter small permease protein n=1 Tax=Ollibium composti TaxID=2675109 RepID=A0ABY2Q2M4_9HYPH|nr:MULTISPECIES: TRAP transporter small permease [Mesorhizobium]QDC02396.1 TRAP transporter small permease [Mesorhizobium sp. 8]THF54844.1 TRAP transporter small permease [Mesorhizobium composti]
MESIARLAHRLAAIPLLILLVVFNVAVVMRYFLGRPLQSTEEISGLLMIWIIMLGAIAAEQDDQHLHIPLLLEMCSAKVAAAINLAMSLLSAAFLLYVSYVGLLLAMNVHFKVTGILRISYFWIDIAVPVGFVVIAIYMAQHAIRSARAAFSGHAQ